MLDDAAARADADAALAHALARTALLLDNMHAAPIGDSALEAASRGEFRRMIARTAQALIELLDTIDGDSDLEDGDPAGDPLDMGEATIWGHMALPQYGTDQTRGPINLEAAHCAWRAAGCPGLETSMTS